MAFLRKVFDFYLRGSLHVALAVFSLVKITEFLFKIKPDFKLEMFIFSASVIGYNFVKYVDVNLRKTLHGNSIRILSVIAGVSTIYFYFQLQPTVKLGVFVFGLLTALYALPIIPHKVNLRNWAGIKIYLVSVCWSGVTVLLPVLNAEILFNREVWILAIQRFILVLVLLLIFEIIDLRYDNPDLKTVPQQIGIRKTKFLGYLLLLIYCSLEILNPDFNFQFLCLKLFVAIITMVFLFFANENRSKYYTSFWVESIPIFWYLLIELVRPF